MNDFERIAAIIQARIDENKENKEDGKTYTEEEYLIFAIEECIENQELEITIPKVCGLLKGYDVCDETECGHPLLKD